MFSPCQNIQIVIFFKQGNPLYSLYQQLNGNHIADDENRVLDVVREAKMHLMQISATNSKM